MRQAEIINLTWEEIDLKTGFFRLGKERIKNKTPRVIPLHPRVADFLQNVLRTIHGGYVFSQSSKFK